MRLLSFFCLFTGLVLNSFSLSGQEPPAANRPEIVVPYVPTPHKVVDAMLKLAAVKEGDVVADLGCGDGRIPIAAVRDYKAKFGLGIDYNLDRIRESTANAKKAGPAIEKKLAFRQGDVLKLEEKDFDGIDVVTLYLLPEVNERLGPVLQKGLKAGARVVSLDFRMGKDWPPEKSIEGEIDGVSYTLHVWTIGKK